MNRKTRAVLLASSWLLLPVLLLARDLPSASAAVAGLSDAGIARLDAAMERHVRDRRIPGAVVLLARNGSVVRAWKLPVASRPSRTPCGTRWASARAADRQQWQNSTGTTASG
jgi:hypothetical protein